MIDFLHSWQDAIVGSIAIVIALVEFYFKIRRKLLAYSIEANESILSVPEEEKEKIKILFESKRVQDVHLLVLKIFNDSRIPIRSDDFDGPLKIYLGKNTKILNYNILDSVPKRLKEALKVTVERNPEPHILIHPFLLNRKDNFSIKLLLTNFNGAIDFYSQIAGIKERKIVKVEGYDWFVSLIGVLIGLQVWASFFLRFLIPKQTSTETIIFDFSDLLIIGLGIVFGFAGYALGTDVSRLLQSIKRNKRL